MKRIGSGIVRGMALAVLLLAAASGCARECPTGPEYEDLIVGTWYDANTGWRTTFGADGLYRARLYNFYNDVTLVGEYRMTGNGFEVTYTRYSDGASWDGWLDATIVTLTDDTLVFDYNDNGWYGRSRNRRVS